MQFYIYAFIEGHEVLYVGKGSGSRLKQQEKRFGFAGKIIEHVADEHNAYAREVYWISQLKPTLNKNRGGAGSFRQDVVPSALRGLYTLEEWKREERKADADQRKMEKIGTRRYAAAILLRHLDERNCESFGLSKVDISRFREVANGPGY